jgi:hypothetical protein
MPRDDRKCVLDEEDYKALSAQLPTFNPQTLQKIFEEEKVGVKFKVDQLKIIVKYLRDARNYNISPSGKKSKLIEQISSVVYQENARPRSSTAIYPGSSPNTLSQPPPTSPPAPIISPTSAPIYMPYGTFQPQPQPPTTTTYTPSRQNHSITTQTTPRNQRPTTTMYNFLNTTNAHYSPQQSSNTSHSHAYNSISSSRNRYSMIQTERVKTDDERHLFQQINRDRSMGGLIDCFSDPEELIDVKSLRVTTGKTSFQFEIRQSIFNQLMVPKDSAYQIQMYLFTDLLKPKNWGNDTSVYVNNHRCELPKMNRKLAKKMNKEILISSSPITIDKVKCIRGSGWIDVSVNAPTYSGLLEGVFVIMLCRIRTIDELIEIVRSRSPKLVFKDESQEHHLDIDLPPILPTGTTIVTVHPTISFKAEPQNHHDDDDDVMVHDVQVIPLKDPVSMDRIEIPVKGRTCVHRTVFDLSTYLHFGHSSHSWNCPCCDKPLPFVNLIVDDIMDKIVNEVDQSAEKIILHIDGSYEVPTDTKSSTPKIAPMKRQASPYAVLNTTSDDQRMTPPLLDIVVDDFDDRDINPGTNSPPLYSYSDLLPGLNYPADFTYQSPQQPTNGYATGSTVDDAIEIDD